MMRALYRILLWLHPPVFRRQFADEMLWIFEESPESQATLCLDGAASLLRQWLLRSGWWRIAIASAIAFAEIILGGFGMLTFGPHPIARLASEPKIAGLGDLSSVSGLAHQPLTVGIVMYLSVFVIGGLALLILGLSLWVKGISARRRPVALRVR